MERSRLLLLLGLPFGVLCGSLGLGGTEYRAPVLRSFFRYSAERLAPFNLAISFMTLGAAIVGRGPDTSATLVRPFLPELLALGAGALAGLGLAGRYAGHIARTPLERVMPSALVWIGTALICVTVLPFHFGGLPFGLAVRLPAALVLGLWITVVSRARNTSGSHLLIPALVLAFGADIKIAGSASICISLPIVLAGIVHGSRDHGYPREREYQDIVLPMGAGSALGAIAGGHLAARATSSLLTLLLGALLIASAVKRFQDSPAE